MAPEAHSAGPMGPAPVARPGQPLERLDAFLARNHVEIRDVIPAAGPRGRRLLLGSPGTDLLTHAVAIADAGDGPTALDTEHEVLTLLQEKLDPQLSSTVPHVVERVEASSTSTGLVVTAVPGLHAHREQQLQHQARGRAEQLSPLRLLVAVDAWLEGLWSQTTSADLAPVEVGVEGARWLVDRFPDTSRLRAELTAIHRAERLLAPLEVRYTAVHGCLCPRHVMVDGDRVSGVDDWGLGSTRADPLRDLGGFAVRVADQRLGEVLGGRTSFARHVRGFVVAGLTRVELPTRLWRELLVLAQIDRARDAAERGDADPSVLITSLTRVLPAASHADESRRT